MAQVQKDKLSILISGKCQVIISQITCKNGEIVGLGGVVHVDKHK